MAREPIKPEACATCGWSELRGVDLCSVCGAHHTDLPRARQRQPRVPTASGWQPIETAPRDGQWFLVWQPHHRKHDLPCLAHWTMWPTLDRGRWETSDERVFVFSGCGPTPPPTNAKWHALPELP